jgi:hypothetical protein
MGYGRPIFPPVHWELLRKVPSKHPPLKVKGVKSIDVHFI